MDPSLKFAFDEILRRLDALDARMEQSFSRTLASVERGGAAVELRAGSLERSCATQLVESDNWGGLFDNVPDEPVPALDSTSSDLDALDSTSSDLVAPDHDTVASTTSAAVRENELAQAVEKQQFALQEAERSGFLVARAEQERRAAIIRAEGLDLTPPQPSTLVLASQIHHREFDPRVLRYAPVSASVFAANGVVLAAHCVRGLLEAQDVKFPGEIRAATHPGGGRPIPELVTQLHMRAQRTKAARRSRPLRRLLWRPPWRLASCGRRPRRRGHRIRSCALRPDPEAGHALCPGRLTERFDLNSFLHGCTPHRCEISILHHSDAPKFRLELLAYTDDPVDPGPKFTSQSSFRIHDGAEVAVVFRKLDLNGAEGNAMHHSPQLPDSGVALHRFECGVPTAAFLLKLRGGTCSITHTNCSTQVLNANNDYRTNRILHHANLICSAAATTAYFSDSALTVVDSAKRVSVQKLASPPQAQCVAMAADSVLSAAEATRHIKDLGWCEYPVGSLLSVRAGMRLPSAAMAEVRIPICAVVPDSVEAFVNSILLSDGDVELASYDMPAPEPSSASMMAMQCVRVSISRITMGTEGLGASGRAYAQLDLSDTRLGAFRALRLAGVIFTTGGVSACFACYRGVCSSAYYAGTGPVMETMGLESAANVELNKNVLFLCYEPVSRCANPILKPAEMMLWPYWELGKMEGTRCISCVDAHVDIVIVIQLSFARRSTFSAITCTLAEHREGGSLQEHQDIKLLRLQGVIRFSAQAPVASLAAGWLSKDVRGRGDTCRLQHHYGDYNSSFSHGYEHSTLVGAVHLHVRVFASLGNPVLYRQEVALYQHVLWPDEEPMETVGLDSAANDELNKDASFSSNKWIGRWPTPRSASSRSTAAPPKTSPALSLTSPSTSSAKCPAASASTTSAAEIPAGMAFHQELGVDSGGGISVPVHCARLLGAFGLQWLAWNSFQKLTEEMEVRDVENMAQEDVFCSRDACSTTRGWKITTAA